MTPSAADADTQRRGYQVSLADGETTVELEVRYGTETRVYTVRFVLVSDRPVVSLERVSATVTEGEDAVFRLRLLPPDRIPGARNRGRSVRRRGIGGGRFRGCRAHRRGCGHR